jgi:type 1 glutamine amidotransferase
MKRMIAALVLGLFLFAAPSHAQTTPTPAAGGEKAPKKRLLLITESRGFVHGVVARPVTIAKDATIGQLRKFTEGLENSLEVKVVKTKVKGKDKDTEKEKLVVSYNGTMPKEFTLKDKDQLLVTIKPCLVEKTFMDLAEKTGLFTVVCSQNARAEITGENLKNYDAVFFYTTGELPLSDGQKSDLLAFVKNGKGFGGSHCATDTFYSWKEYGELIGGYFDGHPWNAGTKIKVIVEDKNHAATKHLGDSFVISDEIYQFKTPYDRSKLHVLMRLDMDSVKNQGKRADKDNALAWTHDYGKGRVFYTALGHQNEVWEDERFQKHIVGGLRYMFGMEK